MLWPAERRRFTEYKEKIEDDQNEALSQVRLAEITIKELTPFIASCCKDRPTDDPYWDDKTDKVLVRLFLNAVATRRDGVRCGPAMRYVATEY